MATAMNIVSMQSGVQPMAVARSARQRVNPVPMHFRSIKRNGIQVVAPLRKLATGIVPSRQIACAAVDGSAVKSDTNSKTKGATPVEKRNCKIYTTEGTNTKLEMLLSFIDDSGQEVGTPVDLSTFASVPWRVEGEVDPVGVVYEGEAVVPAHAKEELIMLRIKKGAKAEQEWVNKIEITSGDYSCHVAPNSWVHKNHGSRLFFADGLSYLPSQTPADLQEWRMAALQEIQGTRIDAATRREEWDRIYDYDVYNDLAGVRPDGTIQDRNILGSAEHPYPRRMRTGRARVEGAPIDPANPSGPKKIYETRDTESGNFWTPLDERFDTTKQLNFNAYGMLGAIPATAEALRRKLFDSDKQLSSFKEVDSLYAKLADPKLDLSNDEVVSAMKSPQGRIKDSALRLFGINPDDVKLQLPLLSAISSSVNSIKSMVGGIKGLLTFPPPLVYKGRAGEWAKDEEFGRQALAGVNPSSIKAVLSRSQLGSMFTDAQLEASMEGHSVLGLIASNKTDPRLLVIDHTAVFDAYAKKISEQKDRYGYWGRAVLYRRNDDLWVPIAIELHGADGESDVYTPKDPANYWLLAKGVFASLDSGFHQLVTHWLRSHACTEPYIISTHRNLSVLHPVYKLLVPHFRFTMQINANARIGLINAEGGIESVFTPGRWAVEMSSAVYGALWRFDKENLPEDLISRGLATRENGQCKILLKDYPYGDDGLLLWNAIEKWVGKYLALYYDDSVEGKRVSEDPEIQAWWDEIQVKGHPEKLEGWPQLNNIKDLTNILSTMIWIQSGHHAAINFSQYAFTGYILNRPMVCRKKMPARGSKEYEEMVKSQATAERVYIDTLTENANSIRGILTVEVLSTHADNEAYMGDPEHAYILDPKALSLYKEFAEEVRGIEAIVKQRNKDPARKMRSLPYEFLIPQSGPGITNRGVPQSVSI